MSKRTQTENLHLYAYENLRGLPTFLKDWSDNAALIDAAYVNVNETIGAVRDALDQKIDDVNADLKSDINGLDERLTTAEQTISDLSPESIQDYKIRLDALEKKVSANTNAIKDVNTRIGTIDSQINSINAEQTVQNSRLNNLENIAEEHTGLIHGLRTDLTSIDGRVTAMEACCETVKHEIEDLQNDVNGFNEDITILATQFETVTILVNQLNELVNSLQLDVVRDMLDQMEATLATKQDKLIPGVGIDITDNVISATGGGNISASYDAATETITLS